MKKKYVISNKKGFLTFLTGIMSCSMLLGVLVGTNVSKSIPKNEEYYKTISTNIEIFVEDALKQNIDIETIETEAKLLGRKEGLQVVFIDEGLNLTKVNVILDIVDKPEKISTFYVNTRELI